MSYDVIVARARWHGQRRRRAPGRPRAAGARAGAVRPGARPRVQPRRLADHPAVLLRGPGLRAAAAARLRAVGPAGARLRPDVHHARPAACTSAGRTADRRRQPARGPAVGPAARGARRRRDPPPVPDAAPAGRRGGAVRGRRPGSPARRRRWPRTSLAAAARGRPALRRAGAVWTATADGGVRVHDRGRHVRGRRAGDLPRARGRRSCWPTSGCRWSSSGRSCTGSSPTGGVEPYAPDRHPIYIHERRRRARRSTASRRSTARTAGRRWRSSGGGAAATPETIDRVGAPRRGRAPCAGHLAGAADPARARSSRPRPACTRPRPTSTSSSRRTRSTRRSSSPAASPGTASSSCRWSARSSPTWPSTGRPTHPIGLFDPGRFRSH